MSSNTVRDSSSSSAEHLLKLLVFEYLASGDSQLSEQFVDEVDIVPMEIQNLGDSLSDIVNSYKEIIRTWNTLDETDWELVLKSLVGSYLDVVAPSTGNVFQSRFTEVVPSVGFGLQDFVKFHANYKHGKKLNPETADSCENSKKIIRSKYFPKGISAQHIKRLKLSSQCRIWIPPTSPFNLIQEKLYSNPWKLLVATIFLNKTNNRVCLPLLDKFFQRWSTPEEAFQAEKVELAKLLRPMGLNNLRANTLMKFSWEYLNVAWSYPIQLHGIGKYGNDSYKIFCVNEWREVKPKDKKLNLYHEWLKLTVDN